MSGVQSLPYSTYEDETYLAERELSMFVRTITAQVGPDQALAAKEDWLEESDLIDAPPLDMRRDWRSVTIAALARFSNRIGLLRTVTDVELTMRGELEAENGDVRQVDPTGQGDPA